MSGPCGIDPEPKSEPKPTRLWRNGMDYEPKRVGPPDYSNVPDVRSWQMSPFSHERFDLDEIQRAEKKGFKGRFELERLKQLYGGGFIEKTEEEKEREQCARCAERERAEQMKRVKCTTDYMYQPYGPSIVSALSYSRPESGRPRMYGYMGPSIITSFRSSDGVSHTAPVPCESIEMAPRRRDFRHVYIPYGPMAEIRLTPDQYVPMGPSTLPISH